MTAALKRETFEISNALEYFTEKELAMQIGHARAWWPIAILAAALGCRRDRLWVPCRPVRP